MIDSSSILNMRVLPHGKTRRRTRISIGVPWVLVLVYTFALVVSSVIGLVLALWVP